MKTFKNIINESLDLRTISLLLSYKKDIDYNETYNEVRSKLALRDLLAKVQKILKVKFKKEPAKNTEGDLYSIGNIEILATETGINSTLKFFKKGKKIK